MKSILAGLVAVAAIASGAAQADEPVITLRLADSLPVGHIIHEAVTKPFIEAVEKRTGGKVVITHFRPSSSARPKTCCG